MKIKQCTISFEARKYEHQMDQYDYFCEIAVQVARNMLTRASPCTATAEYKYSVQPERPGKGGVPRVTVVATNTEAK